MVAKFKYNDGDKIGPHNITLIKRTYKEKTNNVWHGDFKCPRCGKILIQYYCKLDY